MIQTLGLENKVKGVDWKQFIPIYGMEESFKDASKGEPCLLVYKDYLELTPKDILRNFCIIGYHTLSTFGGFLGLLYLYKNLIE